MSIDVDVVVVGGGLGGLSAAAEVARQGLSCVLVERAGSLGGRATTNVREGFHMNLGGHALYRGGAAARVLGRLGVAYEGMSPPTGRGVAVKDGESHILPTGLGTLLTTTLFGARGKLEFARLLTRLARTDLEPLETVPFSAWLDANISDACVRAAIEALVRVSTYTNASDRLSAAAAFRQLRLAAKPGVLYLHGGWETLVQGLANVARKAGVRVVTNGAIDEIAPVGSHENAWCVRQSDGSVWRTRSLVLAVGPRAAHKMVAGPSAAKAMLEVWAEACIPARAACLDVGLQTLPQPDVTFALGLDAPLYFSVHSSVARLAPSGQVLIHAMKYLSPDDRGSPDDHARELDAWLDRCQPGWRDSVVTKRYLPDMIATNDIVRVHGGGASGRPGPSVPRGEGLFVVGDWVGHQGMLADAAFASAAEAARLVMERASRPVRRAAG